MSTIDTAVERFASHIETARLFKGQAGRRQVLAMQLQTVVNRAVALESAIQTARSVLPNTTDDERVSGLLEILEDFSYGSTEKLRELAGFVLLEVIGGDA